MDPRALKIYTDGSAYDNPGKRCGWGILIEYPDHLNMEDEEFSESIEGTTINRMELTAVVSAIKLARIKCKEYKIQRVFILSDSQYVVDNYKKASAWRKNNWCNYAGAPVENSDLWKEFLSVLSVCGVRIEITWTPGKSSPQTKQVDKIAKLAAKKVIKKKDFGYVKGKISKPINKGIATLYNKGEGFALVRVYEYKATKQDQLLKVKFELCLSDGTVSSEGKFFAYYYQKNREIEFSRHHVYKVYFEEDIRKPVFSIVEK